MTEYLPPPPAGCSGRLYTVKSGDTLFLIAQSCRVSLDMLIKANPQIKDPHMIYPGQIICIPVKNYMGEYCYALKPEPKYEKMGCCGMLWMKKMDDGTAQVMVMGTNMPDPGMYGERYRARFEWDGGSYEMPMDPIMSDPVWWGFRRERFDFLENFFEHGTIIILPGPVLQRRRREEEA